MNAGINNAPELYSRRDLFTKLPAAAIGAGVVAAAATSAALSGCGKESNAPGLDVLKVSDNSVVTLDSYTEEKDITHLCKVEDVCELPAGSLVFSSDGKAAAALMPGDTASPLSILKLIDLKDGKVFDGLSKAVGNDEGFSLYEVRCSASLCAWVESNYLTGDWRVFTAPVKSETTTTSKLVRRYTATTDPDSGDTYYDVEELVLDEDHHSYKLGDPVMVDEGNADYDAPEIAVVEGQAFWIVQPSETGSKTEEDSLLKNASGAATPGVLYTSHGRFCGGLTVNGGMLTALPRAESSTSVHYQMTAFNGGAIAAQTILPHSYRPNTCIYLNGGFAFGINGSYDYGDGIANVGTYIPLADGTYLRLTKSPVTPPGTCGDWVYCKSNSRTVFVDTAGQRYFTVAAPSGTEQYGDYPVQQGAVDELYTYATVITSTDGPGSRKVVVRRIKLGDHTKDVEDTDGDGDPNTTTVIIEMDENIDDAMADSQAEAQLGLNED